MRTGISANKIQTWLPRGKSQREPVNWQAKKQIASRYYQ